MGFPDFLVKPAADAAAQTWGSPQVAAPEASIAILLSDTRSTDSACQTHSQVTQWGRTVVLSHLQRTV